LRINVENDYHLDSNLIISREKPLSIINENDSQLVCFIFLKTLTESLFHSKKE